MSQPDFYAILDDCVTRMSQGDSLEACLADYPDQVTELNPALALSADLMHLSPLEPTTEVLAQGYEAMMETLATQDRPSWFSGLLSLLGQLTSPLKPREAGRPMLALRVAMLLLIILIAGSAFTITASADSLPGDALYPVKRSWENTRLALTFSEPSRQALESRFAQHRREEVQAVLALRRPVTVEFEGRLQATGDVVWLVDGLSVEIGEGTIMRGAIAVGQEIFVRAQVQPDGKLAALQIVGDESLVPDREDPGQRLEPTDRPQPTAELAPTHEPTRQPTRLPTRPPTREATATQEPTRKATPTPEHELKDIRPDARTPTPVPEDRPTEVPPDKPTETPRPKDEPTRDTKPTPTYEPTDKPEPTATQEPTREATATHDSKPTREPTATHEATAIHEPTPTKAFDSGG